MGTGMPGGGQDKLSRTSAAAQNQLPTPSPSGSARKATFLGSLGRLGGVWSKLVDKQRPLVARGWMADSWAHPKVCCPPTLLPLAPHTPLPTQ